MSPHVHPRIFEVVTSPTDLLPSPQKIPLPKAAVIAVRAPGTAQPAAGAVVHVVHVVHSVHSVHSVHGAPASKKGTSSAALKRGRVSSPQGAQPWNYPNIYIYIYIIYIIYIYHYHILYIYISLSYIIYISLSYILYIYIYYIYIYNLIYNVYIHMSIHRNLCNTNKSNWETWRLQRSSMLYTTNWRDLKVKKF